MYKRGLTFVRRRGTSCTVPAPLCGNVVTFVSFVNETRVRNHNFHKDADTDAHVALPLCADGKTKVFINCISKSIIKANTFLEVSCAPLVCLTHALMFVGGFASIAFTEALVDFLGKPWIKISVSTICLSPTALLSVLHFLPAGPARPYVLKLARRAVKNLRNTSRQ